MTLLLFPDTTKRCGRCKVIKPVADFYQTGKSRKPEARCRVCRRDMAMVAYRQMVAAETSEQKARRLKQQRLNQRAYRLRHGDRVKKSQRLHHVRKTFGLSAGEYEMYHTVQGGCCAICRRGIVLGENDHIDHCHGTGKVRGILCNACNSGLGFFRDNPKHLLRAIAYLEAGDENFLMGRFADLATIHVAQRGMA